ncbi:MAG: bacteriohemerythrin [Acidimicrobiia bacterium]
MSFFDWTPALDVHVDAMNNEHKKLIDLMNVLHDKVEAKAGKSLIGLALDQLAQYTVRHFADEEAYMASVGFVKLEVHKGLHKQLLDRFGGFQKEFEQTGELTTAFFDFLRFWLTAHIKSIDTQYTNTANLAPVGLAGAKR